MSYLAPGVYVEEKSSGIKPIEGVGTSNGAFVGIAEKGPIGKAVEIPNWTKFVNTFGGYIPNGLLAYAVNMFFKEGGTLCYVVRTCHYTTITSATSLTARVSGATLMDADATPAPSMRVMASSEGKWGDRISIDVETTPTEPREFNLIVKYRNDRGEYETVERLEKLTISNVEDEVKNKSAYIRVEKDAWTLDKETKGSQKPPKAITGVELTGGYDGVAIAANGTLTDGEATPGPSMWVTAASEGVDGNKINVEVKAATTGDFKLSVKFDGFLMEEFDNLKMDTVEKTVKDKSAYIRVEKDIWYDSTQNKYVVGSGKIPKVGQTITLANGSDSTLQTADFEGDEKAQNGLHAFDVVDDINIVAIPDSNGTKVINEKGLNYCQTRKDCIFLVDPTNGLDTDGVKNFRSSFNSSYGALYYPWVIISDPLTGMNKLVPPSGAVAGTYAYTDTARGVHKAPAGISEGYLDSVSDLEKNITKSEQTGLNPVGINAIRSFPGSGICIWGARTLSADPEWRYVNIRRLFLYLEKSIYKATQWVVFEPNTPALWGSVVRNITAFLLMVWRNGALFGGTADEAFYVKVDAENNPPEVRDAGQLIIEVGVAPVKPAEFVIIRISQKTLAK